MKSIDKFKHYVYNNNDITQIVEEKKRFRRAPINYAVTKNELLKEIVCYLKLNFFYISVDF
jgi:RNA polymerase-associated protein RTF1